MSVQETKIIKNKEQQVERIQELEKENENLAKQVVEIDNYIKKNQITLKSMVLQMASNLEECYTLGQFQYPISCIYSVIIRNLELKGISEGTKDYLWSIFSQNDNRKYMYSVNELASLDIDNEARETLKTELTQLQNSVNTALTTIQKVEAKTDHMSRQLLQHVTMEIQAIAPKLVDKCDRAGIALPYKTVKDDPIRIKKKDPKDNDVCAWLRLLIEELQKVHNKFLVYRTEDPAEMKWYCRGIKVHVQLLRSLSNDKWARNYWTWLGVIKQKVGQSNHSAQSLSGIWTKIRGKRNLTREQIKAKTEMVISFAQEYIEASPAYWDLMYASTHLREPDIGEFHKNRHEKLSDSSIG